MKHQQPIRVGFDLDGVLLYNPARLMRPLIKSYKALKRTKKVTFVVPSTPLQIFIWKLLHLSSIFPAQGYGLIKRLVEEGHIEAYIVTARFASLHENTVRWFAYLNRDGVFTRCIENKDSLQPHLYKEQQIQELGLDVFIDDNWDIVHHLSTSKNVSAEVLWVHNILDAHIAYEYSFPTLLRAMTYLDTKVRT